MKTDAYYSNDLKCWVRLEREVDGEYCHTSGYASKAEALGEIKTVPYIFVERTSPEQTK